MTMTTGQIVRELKGHSGSRVLLVSEGNKTFVRKIGNVKRNAERLKELAEKGYRVPKIYHYDGEILDMEYIHGLDMKSYITTNGIKKINDFIVDTLNSFAKNTIDKDYTEVYNNKLSWMTGNEPFPFTKEQLIQKLPKILPQSMYHGDMTLENIMSCDDGFCLIDGVFIEYDSYIFDIAKMRQDLECKWFIRNDKIKIDVKLKNLQENILNRFPLAKNNALLILMLLRVYLHTKEGDGNRMFIEKQIDRLWREQCM